MTRRDAGAHPGSGVASCSKAKLFLAFCPLLLAGGFAVWQVSTWPVRLRYPGEQNYVEGMRLVEMVHLREGVPIYAPPSPERFDAAIYGPLYYLLGAHLIDPNAPAYFPLRVLSLFATLGCAAGCAVLAYWLTGKLLAAVLAPLIFLSYSMVTLHGLSARCDVVALCLFFWGFLVAFRFRNSSRLLLAVPLMLAGFFYKHQFVAGPLAVVVFLIMERRYRLAAAFIGLMGGSVIGILALLQFVVFQGQDFLLHIFRFNLLAFGLPQFQAGVFACAILFLVPLLVALEALRVRREKLILLYLLAAVGLALVALGKVGSDSNYYLESICLLSALFSTTYVDRAEKACAPLELLVLLGFALFLGQFMTLPVPAAGDFKRDEVIQQYLRNNFSAKAPALSYYAGDLLRAGLSLPISDLYQYSQIIRKGTLPGDHLISSVEEHHYKVIVLSCDLGRGDWEQSCVKRYLTPELAQAILKNYHLVKRLEFPLPERAGSADHFYAWVPRSNAEAAPTIK
ncbi:MAG: hypothetical protein LAN62_11465 [Acidobacteriia bacterium]|nr:hypothetical protein [Terriglobia bacterium]